MLTGELRSKIDDVWNALWTGGIANSLAMKCTDQLLDVIDRINLSAGEQVA